ADVIDIGCTPGREFPGLGDVVRELVGEGMRVSIDSFDPDEIRTAVGAGAELVLSVNASNREVARELAGSKTRVVVIPDFGQGLETLEPSVAALEQWGVSYLIDPVIEPIGFGFMRSLERYAETHRRYPAAPLFMGVGNITELTAADTTGVNALLLAVGQELGVRAVLTTEVIPWARGAVREIDIARRLMYHAVTHNALPKCVDGRRRTGPSEAAATVGARPLARPARQGQRVSAPSPLVHALVPAPDPLETCARFQGMPFLLFLDSAIDPEHLGRYSFLAADPFTAVRSKGLLTQQLVEGKWVRVAGDPLAHVGTLVATHGAAPVAELPPFQGGAAGYVGYDWGMMLERVPRPRYDDLAVPDLLLGLYDWVIAWDHPAGRAWVISTGMPERGTAREHRAASRLVFVREMLAREAGCELRDASPRLPLPASRLP